MTTTATTHDQAAPETIAKSLAGIIDDLTCILGVLDRIEDAEGDIAAHARSGQVPAPIAARHAQAIADRAASSAGEIRRALEYVRSGRTRAVRLADTISEAQAGRL